MSAPDPNDPWAEHYAGHGQRRPPLQKVVAGHPAAPGKIAWGAHPEIELVTTAERARRQAAEEARRMHEALNLLSLLAVAIGVGLLLVVLLEAGNRLGNARPSERRLAAQGREFAAQARQQLRLPASWLEFESTRAVPVVKPSARLITYDLTVTFRLRTDLYAPAASSGAQAYLQMQQSVAEARAGVVQHQLSRAAPALAVAPELPLLLMRAHRAGERLTVKVPLRAERFGWHWRFHMPDNWPLRPDRELTGAPLDSYAGTPYLRFDTPEGRQGVREKTAEGRRFVLAVRAELARQGLGLAPVRRE